MVSHLIIRTDANLTIGTGHFMRCLAVAQIWRNNGGKTNFVMSNSSLEIEKRIKEEKLILDSISSEPGSRDDALTTAQIAQNNNSSWVVIDGYQFKGEYQKIIKNAGLNILFIDDYGHSEHYYADIVLNQNLYADEKIYNNKESYTKLLLGTKYTLLREEFKNWKYWIRKIPKLALKLLITLGGSSANHITLNLLKEIENLNFEKLEVVAITNDNTSYYQELHETARHSKHLISIKSNIINMSEIMSWADVAITSGGITCFESAFMGLPIVILNLTENQLKFSESLVEANVAISLGLYKQDPKQYILKEISGLLQNYKLRKNMSRNGKKLIIGEGTQKVVHKMVNYYIY